MPDPITASIIVNNYNYGRFLDDAIRSALGQTSAGVEVIVVDDGSTDNSRSVIASYGSQVHAVLKENGGQTSAFNAGLRASHGDVIIYLDADDMLDADVVAETISLFRAQPDLVKVHWPLRVVDGNGRPTGAIKPPHAVPHGDLLPQLLKMGPDSGDWPPTSGNAWARAFLDQLFPLPEVEKDHQVGSASADAYLSMLAPLFGRVGRLASPKASYRLHGSNDHSAMSFKRKLERDVALFDLRAQILESHLERRRLTADRAGWEQRSWFHRLRTTVDELNRIVRSGGTFIFVDDDAFQLVPEEGRLAVPLYERDGLNFGPPADDQTAIAEVQRWRTRGATHLIFAWPAFWWLEHYAALRGYLDKNYGTAAENDRIIAFDLTRRNEG